MIRLFRVLIPNGLMFLLIATAAIAAAEISSRSGCGQWLKLPLEFHLQQTVVFLFWGADLRLREHGGVSRFKIMQVADMEYSFGSKTPCKNSPDQVWPPHTLWAS